MGRELGVFVEEAQGLAPAAGRPCAPLHRLRHFRDTVGMTPHAFVIERRIDRAEALLLSGEAIATVACRCGFSSQSHLTSAFRTRRGTTPARWRANFRPET